MKQVVIDARIASQKFVPLFSPVLRAGESLFVDADRGKNLHAHKPSSDGEVSRIENVEKCHSFTPDSPQKQDCENSGKRKGNDGRNMTSEARCSVLVPQRDKSTASCYIFVFLTGRTFVSARRGSQRQPSRTRSIFIIMFMRKYNW
ncbi:unnamed protein product [Amoebophrya sp. A25]|nr:unnamed protein product [Amoebophrya sp. A25]|eukprot:GSA25T00017728001.1